MKKIQIRVADAGLSRVEEFHRAFDCHVEAAPGLPELTRADRSMLNHYAFKLGQISQQLRAQAAEANGLGRTGLGMLLVRLQLHVEETGELAEALRDRDLVAVLDALTDMTYVTDGTWLATGLGVVKDDAHREVHRSNMSKRWPGGEARLDPAGRVLKGPDYSEPDLLGVLRAAGFEP